MPRCESCWRRCQSRLRASLHSLRLANSWPMKRSFLPGGRTDRRRAGGDWRIAATCLRHFCGGANFFVNDFVVRKGEKEIFGEGIKQ